VRREKLDKEAGFIREFASADGRKAVVVEDDGRVCYAYLLDGNGNICGDVWLYNRCPTPEEPEWHGRENAPFANPAPFVDRDAVFFVPASAADMTVEWDVESDVTTARIYLDRELFAKLMDGAKPGWARLAAKDGPLARALLS
jgi:hypothetical protein